MHTITVSLNKRSVEKAIKDLERYKRSLNRKIDTVLFRVAKEIESKAQAIYGGAVKVHAEKDGSGYTVYAEGQAVGFLEFGTGAFADSQHPYTDEVTFPVFPGSYSDTVGAGTYLRWVTAHGTDENYPYNREPLRALYKAVNEVRPIVKVIVEEVFKNDKP